MAYDSRAKMETNLSVKAFMLYLCVLHFFDTNWDLDGNDDDDPSLLPLTRNAFMMDFPM